MKFRTEIDIAPLAKPLEYHHKILSVGSCFATSVGERLKSSKFAIEVNPMGVLFNPCSIVATLNRLIDCKFISEDELRLSSSGVWFHYDFHGSHSSLERSENLSLINSAIQRGHKALMECDCIIITLGTSWVYELIESGKVVANCHKQPSKLFTRKALTVDQIVELFDSLFSRLPNKRVILSVSPIRHLSDGLAENSLSKATLRLAASIIEQRHPTVQYFPAYEIMMDDLRDYRFYESDMVHPSIQAVDYIWEKFQQAAIGDQSLKLLSQIMQITRAASHRPINPSSDEHKKFCKTQLDKIKKLPQINFSQEKSYFESML